MSSIEFLRRKIDKIDEEILVLLEERMRLCREIGEVKVREGLALEDKDRECIVLERAGRYREVFREIIRMCKKVQEVVLNGRI